MKAWMMLAALAFIAVAGLALLTSLQPSGPTGYAIAPATHWIDGSQVLIKADILDAPLGPTPVRFTVEGDIVWKTILVDGEDFELAGRPATDEWLVDKGVLVLRLPPGEHVVHAYSCFDEPTGYKCGCRNPDDCGNWMRRTVTVQ